MPFDPNKTAKQKRESRLELVASLHKKGYSYRQIQEEVIRELHLDTYSVSTVKRDVELLLKEWREHRIKNVESLVQLELERIDDCIRELWESWDKSKGGGKRGGNFMYIAEIRAQLIERRKLLGLYAPEKLEVKEAVNIDDLTQEEKEELLKIARKVG